ncbi:ATPase-like protein involved in chromosome partitioning [Kribbella flavida DSM 17836]|uniref:ATPase-like protein involved in chromosome partitioning n=1 Tax=Kribbella flavida (strain DSM 17836 / JCM 10339 / NBRC 14399) TaxID=479435 RepID=D2PKV1_KRIFD|nr:AAA family ATPase [Kribbella flavida]ADB32418.1 ATPase-like protein involved in chromosome partitioning [Kribbella flavida DSM 17836]
MTDSHNSGQHKDREAAAAEVRRMWQPTPSWTQPDPGATADPATPEADDDAKDALAQEFPGDTWNQPAAGADNGPGQATPYGVQPGAQTGGPSESAGAHRASTSGSAGAHSAGSTPDPWGSSAPSAGAGSEASSWTIANPGSASAAASGAGSTPATPATPAAAGTGGSDPWSQPAAEPADQQSQLSPAAQRFFPQGIPNQHPQQPQRDVSYRADELIQALPLPREAPAERGVRSILRLRPGSAERAERIARATAATAFRRPVTITVANPKGGSGKTPTTLLLAGALGQARGGGVVAWDNNELRGNMHLRTHDTNARSTVTDLLQAMPMLTQPDARLGDVAAYLRHQVAGQYDVLTSATTTYAQIEARDFDQIHRLLSRFYKVLVIDTGNNEGSSNWREAMKASDALVIPIKWKSLSCAAAVQMLEELDHQGPEAQRLIRRAVIAVSNGPGDVNKEVEKQLRPYFESRAAAVVDIPTDQHIAAEGPLDHSALQPGTRRAALELAAKVAEQITIALNVPR